MSEASFLDNVAQQDERDAAAEQNYTLPHPHAHGSSRVPNFPPTKKPAEAGCSGLRSGPVYWQTVLSCPKNVEVVQVTGAVIGGGVYVG